MFVSPILKNKYIYFIEFIADIIIYKTTQLPTNKMLTKSVVLLSILVPCILSASVQVTVSCQPCIRACGFANCMRVSGPGYDR